MSAAPITWSSCRFASAPRRRRCRWTEADSSQFSCVGLSRVHGAARQLVYTGLAAPAWHMNADPAGHRPASNLGFRSCRACQVIPGASSPASLTSVAAPEQHLFLARSGDAGHPRLCDALVHRLQGRGGAAGGRLQSPARRRRRSWTACCRALPTRRGCTRSTGWGRRAPAPPVRRPPLPPYFVTCHPPRAFSPELSWPPFCSTLHI